MARTSLRELGDAVRFWWRQGKHVRRARTLRQYADGLRLFHPPGWEARSLRLYRRCCRMLGHAPGRPSGDPAVDARQALRDASLPYRRGVLALLRLLVPAALVVLLALAAAATLSTGVRLRLCPRDLAAWRPWTVTSGDFGFPQSSTGPASDRNVFFHTRVERNPSLEIDLGGEHLIRGLRVDNRTDCCQERALPLNVEIWNGSEWQLVAQRRAAFKTWRYPIEPVRSAKIRFRRPGTGYFHLKRISVYGQ